MLHIGIDDTDSATQGMCTTYIGARLKERLKRLGEVEDIKLVRLNPNIKYKTRGNASVALSIKASRVERVREIVVDTVEELSVPSDPHTSPGVVFYQGDTRVFRGFYRRALRGVVGIGEAEEMAQAYGGEVIKFGTGRGIVGALAALGAQLEESTYEAIAYRREEKWGTPRKVRKESVFAMDSRTFPLTYNNVDYRDKSVLIVPHTPCPVLFGVRGVNGDVVREGAWMVECGEDIERLEVFRTNQGTDAHLKWVENLEEVEEDSSVITEGVVSTQPRVIQGGHVFFEVRDATSELTCAAFEPTRDFRKTVLKLVPGDRVVVYGGVRRRKGALTLNLEKLEIRCLVRAREVNPRCGSCGRRMESSGRGQGLRCRKCGTRKEGKVLEELEREVEEKLYLVPPSAMRHLSRPEYWEQE